MLAPIYPVAVLMAEGGVSWRLHGHQGAARSVRPDGACNVMSAQSGIHRQSDQLTPDVVPHTRNIELWHVSTHEEKLAAQMPPFHARAPPAQCPTDQPSWRADHARNYNISWLEAEEAEQEDIRDRLLCKRQRPRWEIIAGVRSRLELRNVAFASSRQ